MSLIINCPECRRQLQVPETYGGKQVRCPLCKQTFVAPAEEVIPVVQPDPEPRSRLRDDYADEPPRKRSRYDDDDEPPRRRSRSGGNAFADIDEDDRPSSRYRRDGAWSWSWNPLCGVMYGPIPVGVIVVGTILVLALLARGLR
jgi:LSD1 subclass zinc finger protein